jgi:hypothetical protein
MKMMQSSVLKHSSEIVLYYSERCQFNNLFKTISFNTLFFPIWSKVYRKLHSELVEIK